jgi:hypothetical protein
MGSNKSARSTIPGPGGHQNYLRLPRPGRLPSDLSEADAEEIEKIEKQFELTNQRERSTTRPIPMNGKAHSMQRLRKLIKKLEKEIDSGELSENDAYNAINNLTQAKITLQSLGKIALKVAARFSTM